MKKQNLIASLPFALGSALGVVAMYSAISGILHTTVGGEIATFCMGLVLFTFSGYAAISTLLQKN
jgi:uncharacterized membrane protein YbhN (UPF0104 family)